MTRAFVGLGSNIGEPRRQLQAAMKELEGQQPADGEAAPAAPAAQ